MEAEIADLLQLSHPNALRDDRQGPQRRVFRRPKPRQTRCLGGNDGAMISNGPTVIAKSDEDMITRPIRLLNDHKVTQRKEEDCNPTFSVKA